MPQVEKKKCKRCNQTKPLTDFSKNKRSPDGKDFYCKACVKIDSDNRKAGAAKAKKKQCATCGKIKSAADYTKDKKSPDGLNIKCKQCYNAYIRACRNTQKAGKGEGRRVNPGIQKWRQVAGVLREMAELQLAINRENAACKKRIALIKAYSDEVTEPCYSHQIALQVMLEEFLKTNCVKAKPTVKAFRFGSLRYSRGKVQLKLNVDHAEQRLGKP